MIVEALQEVLDRIPTWPDERQRRAAEILIGLEAASPEGDAVWQLSDLDAAEVSRRLADTDEPVLTLDELDKRLQALVG
jgi:hypothetical protein